MNLKKLAVIPVFLLGLLICFQLSRSIIRIWQSGGRVEELLREVLALEEKKRSLEEEEAHYQTEEFIEDQARNRLQMVKEGERMVILPEGAPKNADVAADGRGNAVGRPKNWELWVEYWRR